MELSLNRFKLCTKCLSDKLPHVKKFQLKTLKLNFLGYIQFALGWFSENWIPPTWNFSKSFKILHRVFLCYCQSVNFSSLKLKSCSIYKHPNGHCIMLNLLKLKNLAWTHGLRFFYWSCLETLNNLIACFSCFFLISKNVWYMMD